MMKCPICNATNETNYKYCRRCGHGLSKCTCGADISTTDKFCHECGKALVVVERKERNTTHTKPHEIRKGTMEIIRAELKDYKFTYEHTIRKNTGCAYNTVRNCLDLLLLQKEVVMRTTAFGKREYKLATGERKKEFVDSNESICFLKKVMEKPYDYVMATSVFTDLTPSDWETYCSMVRRHQTHLLQRLGSHGLFKCERGKLIFMGDKNMEKLRGCL